MREINKIREEKEILPLTPAGGHYENYMLTNGQTWKMDKLLDPSLNASWSMGSHGSAEIDNN